MIVPSRGSQGGHSARHFFPLLYGGAAPHTSTPSSGRQSGHRPDVIYPGNERPAGTIAVARALAGRKAIQVLWTLGLTATCVLALGACRGVTPSSEATTPAAGQASTSFSPEPCGTVSVPEGSAQAFVFGEGVSCEEVKALLTQYFTNLTPVDLTRPDGAGPVAVGVWTCGSEPGAPLSATCSTEDDRQVTTAPA